jgi:ATP-dependent DNA helicase RecG
MPKGRERTDTYVVNEAYRTRLNAFIEKQIALGGQCYIVCPSIEADSECDGVIMEGLSSDKLTSYSSLNLKNAVEYTEQLRKSLPHLRIECLHGRMKAAEKDAIMSRFARGETDVLVSTTVIEVGVNVPNASLMIVENAERFGLSQLHQLRGRVGRGSRKSYCILVSDVNSPVAKARLEIMRTTYDGFEIADKDLALRGPGDFFSQNNGNNFRQSGGFEFDLASNCDDHALFDAAFSAAKGIVAIDPNLDNEAHILLGEMLKAAIAPPSTIS